MISAERERHLAVPGTYNLRDVGGYRTSDGRMTRWGVLLRSDSLHDVSPAGLVMLGTYGLRTVVDLRHPDERARMPNPLDRVPDMRYLAVSLSPTSAGSVESLTELYRMILDDAQPQMRQVVDALCDEEALPALVHCHGGKDRTGVVIALALGAVGVPDETIAADYALTAGYLTAEFYQSLRQQTERSGRSWDRMQPLLTSTEESMIASLRYLQERYGGCRGYLEAVGVPAMRLDALRRALTEEHAESGERRHGNDR